MVVCSKFFFFMPWLFFFSEPRGGDFRCFTAVGSWRTRLGSLGSPGSTVVVVVILPSLVGNGGWVESTEELRTVVVGSCELVAASLAFVARLVAASLAFGGTGLAAAAAARLVAVVRLAFVVGTAGLAFVVVGIAVAAVGAGGELGRGCA
jgi:hypothetical protein